MVGLARICCGFGFEGASGRVLEAGLGLGVDLVTVLDVAVGRGGRVEDVEIDPVSSKKLRCAGRR